MAYNKKEKEKLLTKVFKLIGEDSMPKTKAIKLVGISKNSFYSWIDDKEGDSKKVLEYKKLKREQYARAREDRQENIFDEILTIADATADDIIIDKEGNEIVNHNVIQRDKIRIDARKWKLGKMNSNKYGDKIQQELSGDLKIEQVTGMIIK